jgi:hypothetical protein
LEDPQGTTVTEPVQPEETQGLPEESQEESVSVDYTESDVDAHEPTPATPVESAHTTPSSAPRRRQEDEESDIFADDRSDTFFWRDERPKQRSFAEDEAEAEAYFKQYVTSSFHQDDKTADDKIRVIYPLVKPPESIAMQTVPNLSVQERQSATKVRDHRQNRNKARFWPLNATSYNKARKASQTETVFRMSLTGDDIMKLGFHDYMSVVRATYMADTAGRSAVGNARFVPSN